MKYFTSNKNKYSSAYILLFVLLLMFSSCSPTKYVSEGETLLNKNHIVVANDYVKKADLLPYIKQLPNKRIFGARFHLGLYNLSNINKNRWFQNWLRNIGEEPVIYDPYLTYQSDDEIKSYLSSKGFFDATVSDSVEVKDKESNVFYNIDARPAYTVSKLLYEIADTNIQKLVYFDSVNCLIERGQPYDVDVLQAEKLRIERFIKDIGFFSFSGDNVFFNVDSTAGNREVDIYYGIKELQKIDEKNLLQQVPYKMYNLRKILIYPDFIPMDALSGGTDYLNSLDTVQYNGFYFVAVPGVPRINYDLIIKSLYIKPGLPYNMTNTELSQTHLSSLKTYRLVNIRYVELPADSLSFDGLPMLDGIIQLTPMNQQSFTVELEGTNSAGNLGGALNFIYQHKNLFHGAELFNVTLKGAYETLSGNQAGFKSTEEYGVETSLKLPKFWMPLPGKINLISKYNPKTVLQVAYNYQKMPVYTRTVATATFGYNWNAGDYTNHTYNPLQLNVVKLPFIDAAFERKIDSSYLAYSYKNVMIFGSNYIFVFSNQQIKKSRDYWYLKINAETAGNILSLGYKIADVSKTNGSYNFAKQPFAQYFKADVDLRYNYLLNDFSSIVYRAFAGAGIPYGNSQAMPFAKQYFGGGANGIRAWKVRSLGPGSSALVDSSFLNQTADIKIELNTEYRFKLFWVLEGAVFLDAGNIWTYNENLQVPGGQFKFNKFIDDMAVGTGLGLRFDLDFVLLRTDIGIKLRDPQLPSYPKWIGFQRPYDWSDFSLVLGIGYPF